MSRQGSNYQGTRVGFKPLGGGIYVDVRAVTNPVEPEAPPTKAEKAGDYWRLAVAGSKQGQVRRILLYAVVAVGLLLAVSPWLAIPSLIGLVLLLATDRDV